MNQCQECGKTMATMGGLEIHMELAHPAPKPSPVPAVAGAAGFVEPIERARVAIPRTRPAGAGAPTTELHLPAFLRGFDPTLPVTGLLVVAMLVAGVAAVFHRSSTTTPTAASAQAAPAPAPPSHPLAVNPAADQKLAQSFVLDQGDYPDGWTFTPHQSSPSDAQDNRTDAACRGVPDPATVETADVSGMDAQQANGLQASTEVIVFQTAQQANADLASEAAPQAIACAKQGLTRALASDGIAVTDVGIGRFSLSTGNVRSVALHAEVAMRKGAAAGVLFADVVFLQQARAEGQAVFISSGGHFPLDTEQTLVTRFAHKLANA